MEVVLVSLLSAFNNRLWKKFMKLSVLRKFSQFLKSYYTLVNLSHTYLFCCKQFIKLANALFSAITRFKIFEISILILQEVSLSKQAFINYIFCGRDFVHAKWFYVHEGNRARRRAEVYGVHVTNNNMIRR